MKTTTRFNQNSPLARSSRRAGADVAADVPRRGSRRSISDEDRRLVNLIIETEPDFIDDEQLHLANAEQVIFDDAPEIRRPNASWYHPVMDDLGKKDRMPKRSEQVILSGAEERVIFLQFNFARFMISEIRERVLARADRRPTMTQARELLKWHRVEEDLREQIAETNLALVLAMAKRTRMSEVDFADLVSEGNMALLRAIEKFDCGRGFKFSTYACRAILKAFSRQGMKLSKYRQRFPTDFDPKLERSDFLEKKRAEVVHDTADEVKQIVVENRAELSDIERTVIEHRFRIESPMTEVKPLTLEQVGQIIGVTKERVRQIQNKALEKIRINLEETYLTPTKADEEDTDAPRRHFPPIGLN